MGRKGDMRNDSAEIPFPVFFCRRPLWAILAWAGMSTLWCCPSSISSADHGVAHPQRCPEGWFWKGCHSEIKGIKSQVKVWLAYHGIRYLCLKRIAENEGEWTGQAQIRKAHFLWVGEARKSYDSFSQPRNTRGTPDSKTDCNLVSASAVSHCCALATNRHNDQRTKQTNDNESVFDNSVGIREEYSFFVSLSFS